MEKAKEALLIDEEHKDRVLGLKVRPNRRPWVDGSFYEAFFLRGIRVDEIQPGSLTCGFKIPARLTVSRCYVVMNRHSSLFPAVTFMMYVS